MNKKPLCPQSYDANGMHVTNCTRCAGGWSRKLRACVVDTGSEHLPLVQLVDVPDCPLAARCQHQIQRGSRPCPVRARGMVCESALVAGGMTKEEAQADPRSFNADYM